MSRFLFLSSLLALSALASGCASQPEQDTDGNVSQSEPDTPDPRLEKEVAALQGRWVPVEYPAEKWVPPAPEWISFNGNQFSLKARGEETPQVSTYELTPEVKPFFFVEHKPSEITLHDPDSYRGGKIHGIYKIEGDILHLCIGNKNGSPHRFKTYNDNNNPNTTKQVYFTLRREKKD
jgi:uncharacterized protein (TIGR03067 family)